jgi:hypothetical protein
MRVTSPDLAGNSALPQSPCRAGEDQRHAPEALPDMRWECSMAAGGGYLYVGGRLASIEPTTTRTSLSTLSREEGLICARECASQLLRATAGALGSLDRVVRLLKVKLTVPDGLHRSCRREVADAASGVVVDVLGRGRGHECVVVAATTLPEGILVEAEASMRVRALARRGNASSGA